VSQSSVMFVPVLERGMILLDLNRNAFRIVRSLTEEKKEDAPRVAVARKAGNVGGPARAKALTASRRWDIAIIANRARWQKPC
jgi:hypothetical protein